MTMTESAASTVEVAAPKRKKLHGVVVSDTMDKTIVVQVERLMLHKRYRKTIRIRKKFYAHDEKNQAKVGDRVVIISTRPLSKSKRWRLLQITREAAV